MRKKTNECSKFFAQKRKNKNKIDEKLYFYQYVDIIQTQNVTNKTILQIVMTDERERKNNQNCATFCSLTNLMSNCSFCSLTIQMNFQFILFTDEFNELFYQYE